MPEGDSLWQTRRFHRPPVVQEVFYGHGPTVLKIRSSSSD